MKLIQTLQSRTRRRMSPTRLLSFSVFSSVKTKILLVELVEKLRLYIEFKESLSVGNSIEFQPKTKSTAGTTVSFRTFPLLSDSEIDSFIDYLNEQIKVQMKLGDAKNTLLLTGYRNLKSDFEYQMSKNPKLDEIDLLKKLYKSRKDNMEIYKGVKEDLFNQEFTEAEILEPFIPTPPRF